MGQIFTLKCSTFGIVNIRHCSGATFETKSSYCRVARHSFSCSLPSYTAVAWLGFKRRATAVLKSNLVGHSSSIYPGGGVLPYITYTGMCRPTGSWFWSSWFRTGYNISNARKLQFCKQPFELIQWQIAFKNTVQCVNKQTVVLFAL